MRQKFLFTVFIVLAGCLHPVFSQNIEVMSMSDFSTLNPPKSITVKLMEPIEIDNEKIDAGTYVTGNLVNVTSPKRLKRDAGFSFKPVSYEDENGSTVKIKSKIVAPYTVPVDKVEVAKSAALGVGGFFVKGLSTGVAAVKGVVKNEEGNRLKSGVVSAYEASPVSYVKKGEDLNFKKNDIFFLKFPKADKPNYEYKVEE